MEQGVTLRALPGQYAVTPRLEEGSSLSYITARRFSAPREITEAAPRGGGESWCGQGSVCPTLAACREAAAQLASHNWQLVCAL